ncbi:MAG: hypothetical protein AAF696_21845 [Bacteroidota bacterium]
MANKDFIRIRNEFFRTLIFLAVLLAGGFYIFGPKPVKDIQLFCDVENIESRGKERFFTSTYDLLGGVHQSNAFARSGAYSLELFKEKQYGLQWSLDQLEGSEYVEIEVWRKNLRNGFKDGLLVAEVQGILWEAAKEIETDEAGEWVKLGLSLTLDCRSEKKVLKIYCWNSSENKVYFDDLSIKVKGK